MIRRMETATLGAAGVAKALDRSPAAVDPEIHRRVEEIVAAVRDKGDAALLELTERFDRVALTARELAVTPSELDAAERAVGETTMRALITGITGFAGSHLIELLERDPYAMYDDLCRVDGQRHDPCLLDTFIAAVRYMEGAPKKPWWNTAERKREMAARRSGN